MISTKERLAQVLHAAGLFELEERARAAYFDDFESDSATPINDLVHALREAGRPDLAERAMNGEWDGTKEEGDAWAKRKGVTKAHLKQAALIVPALTLTAQLASKLASVVVHADEMLSAKGHAFDKAALEQALHDPDVQAWLKALGPLAPLKR